MTSTKTAVIVTSLEARLGSARLTVEAARAAAKAAKPVGAGLLTEATGEWADALDALDSAKAEYEALRTEAAAFFAEVAPWGL